MRNTWVNQAEFGDWDELLPLADKATKSAQSKRSEKAIFKLFSLGVVTSRDDWAWDKSKGSIERKIGFNVDVYNRYQERQNRTKGTLDHTAIYNEKEVKWTRLLRKSLEKGRPLNFSKDKIWLGNYRPFEKQWLYFDPILNEVQYQTHRLFNGKDPNPSITTMGDSTGKPYFAFAIDKIPDLNFVSPASGGTMTFSRFRISKSHERIDNITDWAFNQFVKHYRKKAGVNKDTIFAYCYAVLHDPTYREKYALNLKREFPRIPLYPDFARWAAWGEELLAMHIGYEDVDPYPLERIETTNAKRADDSHPKPKLKSVLAEGAETGGVVVDEDTQITGIPAGAWDYRLGNRSGIDWVLDQHKEKKPKDPTIREKFDTYRFVDYKESLIELLAKVVRVSVDTVAITTEMQELDRSGWES